MQVLIGTRRDVTAVGGRNVFNTAMKANFVESYYRVNRCIATVRSVDTDKNFQRAPRMFKKPSTSYDYHYF